MILTAVNLHEDISQHSEMLSEIIAVDTIPLLRYHWDSVRQMFAISPSLKEDAVIGPIFKNLKKARTEIYDLEENQLIECCRQAPFSLV